MSSGSYVFTTQPLRKERDNDIIEPLIHGNEALAIQTNRTSTEACGRFEIVFKSAKEKKEECFPSNPLQWNIFNEFLYNQNHSLIHYDISTSKRLLSACACTCACTLHTVPNEECSIYECQKSGRDRHKE